MTTFTEHMFALNAPYNNPYQGPARKLLFVCSAGILRSPTGAEVAARMGYNTRSAGSHTEYALIPLSANLIKWADMVIFVNKENFERAQSTFQDHFLEEELISKSTVLDIPDQYSRNHDILVQIFTDALQDLILKREI